MIWLWLWLAGVVVFIVAGVVCMVVAPSQHDPTLRQFGAQLILSCLVWPIMVLYVVISLLVWLADVASGAE